MNAKAPFEDRAGAGRHSHCASDRSLVTRCAPGALLLLVLATHTARADQGLVPYVTAIPRDAEASPLVFGVFQVERYDSNLFRLPDDISPPGRTRRSALTSITGIGVNLDKSYGLQRFVVNASTSKEIYSPYTGLNDTGSRIASTYYYSVTPAFTGDLSFKYAKVPTDYEYLGFVTNDNPRTTRETRLNADFKPGAALHPRFSVFESEDSSQTATFQLSNSRSHGVQLALLYDFPSGTVIGPYASTSRGKTLGVTRDDTLQLDTDYKQSEVGVTVVWKSTGQARIDGRVGNVNRTGQAYSARNFSGPVGQFNLAYDVTGKSTAHFTAAHSLYASQTSFSSYYAEDIATLDLAYAATGKITVKPQYHYRRQSFKGSPFPVASPLTETTRYATLEVDWAALRSVDFAVSVARSSRNATTAGLQFVDYSASAFARFKF